MGLESDGPAGAANATGADNATMKKKRPQEVAFTAQAPSLEFR
jgi:hypothetical protein